MKKNKRHKENENREIIITINIIPCIVLFFRGILWKYLVT